MSQYTPIVGRQPTNHGASAPLPAASAWSILILRTLYLIDYLLLIFTIYMQVHASMSFFMSYAAAAWEIVVSTAEMIGLSSRDETGAKQLHPVWMFLCELVSISLFAAALGMTLGSYFGTPSQVLVGVWPNEYYVNSPLEPWRLGSFVMEAIGMGLALLFMVIGCVEWCRKAR